MTTDPSEIVAAVVARAAHPSIEDPPSLLRHSPEPRPFIGPGTSADALAAVHQAWARVHAQPETTDSQPQIIEGRSPAAVRSRVRARVVTAAGEMARSAQRDDRDLIGNLIRAVDALSMRVNDIAVRLNDLEFIVQDVVTVTSEDLARVLAALTANAPEPADGSPGSTTPPE